MTFLELRPAHIPRLTFVVDETVRDDRGLGVGTRAPVVVLSVHASENGPATSLEQWMDVALRVWDPSPY